MFKRAFLWVAAAVLGLAVALGGCSALRPDPIDTPQSDEGKTTTPSKRSGKMTMAEYMSERFTSFDMFDAAVRNDEDLVQSLRLFVTDKTDGFTHDKTAFKEYWNALREVRIDLDGAISKKPDGEYISFTFDSGKEVIPFDFATADYAAFSGNEYFPVEDPDKVKELVARLAKLVEAEMPKEGEELKEENGAYFWDADDDGGLEHMWISVIDNGDEAPSVMEVRVFNTKMDDTAILDRGYSVESVRLERDEEGPYVVLKVKMGDYYSHDQVEEHKVRLRDGKVVID